MTLGVDILVKIEQVTRAVTGIVDIRVHVSCPHTETPFKFSLGNGEGDL